METSAKFEPDPCFQSDDRSGKASAIYLNRIIDRSIEYLPLRDKDDSAYRASAGYRYSLEAYALANQIQARYKSPFSSYLLGSMYSQLSYLTSPEMAAAGMFEAFDAGDPRASSFVHQFQASHPQLKLEDIMVARSATRTAK